MPTSLTVQTSVNAPIEKVWAYWTLPQHVMQWNNASPDWHCPAATNDLQVGGKFSYTMAAKDGSMRFDFWGVYDEVLGNELIMITLGDNRKVKVSFASIGDVTEVTETFDAEDVNPVEMQQAGWQAILDNFKKYCESISG
ncbi:MAG: SRPBCC family protein [Chitinophagaceae bacterium]|nr:SRPBCC family protein [Chitinophagaceae bacterium]